MPAGESITSAWNGVLTSSGTHYVITNATWNQTIAPGASVDAGFQGAYSGTFGEPTNCTLNGQSCAGSAPPPPDTTAPTAPTGLAASSPTATTISLHWNASSDNVGVAGYRVYSGSTQVATTTTATSTTVTGLAPSTSYTFTVKAFDAAGNVSSPSNAVTTSTTAPPAGGLTATFAKSNDWGTGFVGGYTIKNNGSTTVNGWRLEFDLPSGASVTSAWNATMSSSGSHYVLTNASWNQTIAPGASADVGFQVAYTSPFDAPQNCLLTGQPCAGGPPDTTPPSAPTGLIARSPTAATISLSWKASSDNVGVTGYRVYSGSTQVATATRTSTTVTGLTSSTSYTFTVRAFDAAGNLSQPSNAVTASTTAAGPSTLGITVSGNQLLDGSGGPLHVAGVNRSGSEYACAQGWGLFDGPTDDASIAAMAAWHINAVRVPLNEDCWLGINGVRPAYAGANYQAAIRDFVDRLQAHGLNVILDLHWGAPGTQLALGQEQAPDADHSPAFWASVAAEYKGVRGIAFDLFNEPHDISWSCWLNGCTMPDGSKAAGEQQLIDAVRGAGATQPVIVEGLNWGGDLSGWLANEPKDPAGQLAAGWHIYNFSGCNTTSCWDSTVAPVAQHVPVLATEVGENDCAGGFLNTLLPWADSHGIGYVAWAWNVASCTGFPSLISDYSGTPTAYGTAYKAYLANR